MSSKVWQQLREPSSSPHLSAAHFWSVDTSTTQNIATVAVLLLEVDDNYLSASTSSPLLVLKSVVQLERKRHGRWFMAKAMLILSFEHDSIAPNVRTRTWQKWKAMTYHRLGYLVTWDAVDVLGFMVTLDSWFVVLVHPCICPCMRLGC
jgi:hypothetical protein